MGSELVLYRATARIAWDLRWAWATGRRVALSLDRGDRIEGHVTHVSATDSRCFVGQTLVPLDTILAVHNPSRLGDSTAGLNEAWRGPALRPDTPQAEELDGVAEGEREARRAALA